MRLKVRIFSLGVAAKTHRTATLTNFRIRSFRPFALQANAMSVELQAVAAPQWRSSRQRGPLYRRPLSLLRVRLGVSLSEHKRSASPRAADARGDLGRGLRRTNNGHYLVAGADAAAPYIQMPSSAPFLKRFITRWTGHKITPVLRRTAILISARGSLSSPCHSPPF
jgi:hypothetical protein